MLDSEITFAKHVAGNNEDRTIEKLEREQSQRLSQLVSDLLIKQKRMLNDVVDGMTLGAVDATYMDKTGLGDMAIQEGLLSPERAVEKRKASYFSYLDKLENESYSSMTTQEASDKHREIRARRRNDESESLKARELISVSDFIQSDEDIQEAEFIEVGHAQS